MIKNKKTSTLIVTQLTVGELGTNCYIISDTRVRQGVIIDPGDASDFVSSRIEELEITPMAILATHGHFDHILGVFGLQAMYQIPFLIHPKDLFLVERMKETAEFFLKHAVPDMKPCVDTYLKKGMIIPVGNYTIKVIETPGHTPGSVSLSIEDQKMLFTGDTLFKEGVGRTDFSYASTEDLRASVKKLLSYAEDTLVYPGHGESTYLRNEIQTIHL